MQTDNLYLLQLFFMSLSTVFLILVLNKQIKLYFSTVTEYTVVRKIILGLVVLAFLGNFSHIEAGHLIHSIQTFVMSVGWWLLYKSIADALVKADKLQVDAKEKNAQLESVKIHQKSQSEAISELAPKTAQKINDLTATKDIEEVAKLDKDE